LGGWGATISGAGHAAVLGLAVWALPWLRAGPDPGVPVLAVRLVDPSELLAPPLPPAPAVTPAPVPGVVAPEVVARPEATVPHPEMPPEAPPVEGLGERFDAAAPLGIGPAPEAVAPEAGRLAPEAGAVVPEEQFGTGLGTGTATGTGTGTGFGSGFGAGSGFVPGASGRPPDVAGEAVEASPVSAEAYGAGVRAAVERAKVYPRAARERGLYGTAGVTFLVGPAGEVMALRLVRSSGAKALDDAALAAVRDARLPVPPAGVPLGYDLGISFTLRDK
jgi:TonB family protein